MNERGKNKKGRFNKERHDNPMSRYEGNVYSHIFDRFARIQVVGWNEKFSLPEGRELGEAEGVRHVYLDEELVRLNEQQQELVDENFDNWTEEDSTLIASA